MTALSFRNPMKSLYKKWIQNRFWILFLFCTLFPHWLLSHHTPGGGDTISANNSRFIDPFTGKREKPNNYAILTYDLQKGAKDNKNIHTGSVFTELVLGSGNFAVNFSVPYLYFDQKDRKDATRIGKAYLGAKYMPFFDLDKSWILILETRVGFPSGPDTDRFTGGDYYLGSGIGTFGYLWNRFAFMGKVTGNFPLSKLHPKNQNLDDGIPYWARVSSATPEPEAIELKKTTIYSAYVTYYVHEKISLFTGFLYRNPYEGAEKILRTGDQIPSIFREASVGFSYNLSEKYFLGISYRYPLLRDKDFRIYESALTTVFSIEF
jgi:hypothetical protein